MGKKRNQTKQQPKANASFDQMMAAALSKAQLNALKPYIDQIVEQAIISMLPVVRQSAQELGAMNSRHLIAMQQLLDVDSEALSERIADLEDEALGQEKTHSPIKVGDSVRFSVKEPDNDEYERITLMQCAVPLSTGSYQTGDQAFEEALIGMSESDTKELTLENIPVIVTIGRVTAPIPKEEKDSEETTSA